MKIIVIGEEFIDRYHIGTAERLSPEGPFPIVKITDVFDQEGGAANVVRNLEALGVSVIPVYPMSSPPVKNRLMVGPHQLVRWDENDRVDEINVVNFRYLNSIATDAVIVSDYCKGAIGEDVLDWLRRYSGLIFIDTKGDPERYPARHLFFPNYREFLQYKAYSNLNVILKRGENGISYKDKAYPALSTNVTSVNGAGDTVLAAFVYRYLSITDAFTLENRIDSAIRYANAAAAVVCRKPYTATASPDEIWKLLKVDRYANQS